jgi:2-hydroxy-3-oxopropionate reductase
MTEKVGFIGLGVMGKPMARNLMKAGNALVVLDHHRESMEELAGEGAETAESPKEVAQDSDIIITMLPDSPQVREVVAGKDGVLEGAREGSLIVDMSSISPPVSQELARAAQEKGVRMLDAPVSGGDVGAQQGTLSIMVGGSGEDFELAKPLFEVMGGAITYVGPAGTGQVVKVANQIVVALTIEAVSEALVLCSKSGVDPARTLDALSGGLAGNQVMKVRRDNFLNHDFSPGFRLDLHHKDLGNALAAGREFGVPLPMTALVDQMLQALRMKGHGGEDHSALLRVIEDWAQQEIA